MIQYQILQTNIMRIVWQTVRRITNEILGRRNSPLVTREYMSSSLNIRLDSDGVEAARFFLVVFLDLFSFISRFSPLISRINATKTRFVYQVLSSLKPHKQIVFSVLFILHKRNFNADIRSSTTSST